jgi:small subunit ribosomal protein S9
VATKTSGPADYIPAVGRRKTAVARVRVFPGGNGNIIVNGRDSNAYFGREALTSLIRQPLRVVDMGSNFNITVKVVGGGISGQAGAIRHGIARALVKIDEATKQPLRQAGLLTRDPRVKERKKYGLKRARKRPQYTKR